MTASWRLRPGLQSEKPKPSRQAAVFQCFTYIRNSTSWILCVSSQDARLASRAKRQSSTNTKRAMTSPIQRCSSRSSSTCAARRGRTRFCTNLSTWESAQSTCANVALACSISVRWGASCGAFCPVPSDISASSSSWQLMNDTGCLKPVHTHLGCTPTLICRSP
jgi:hypothetical protein